MPKTKHLYFDLQASWDSNTCATANRAYCPPELTSLHAVLYILTRKSGRVAWSWISTNEKTPNLQSLCKTTLQDRLSYWITRCMSELLSSYIAVIHLLALSGWKTSAIQINLILGMLPGLIFFFLPFSFFLYGVWVRGRFPFPRACCLLHCQALGLEDEEMGMFSSL